jgi:isocitrate dehydrogenase
LIITEAYESLGAQIGAYTPCSIKPIRQVREPIVISNILRLDNGWTKPIIVGRHAYRDQNKCQDNVIDKPGKLLVAAKAEEKRLNFLPQSQRAFREKSSTADNLLNMFALKKMEDTVRQEIY